MKLRKHFMIGNSANDTLLFADDQTIPVSYTHLDVYKRQGYISADRRRNSSERCTKGRRKNIIVNVIIHSSGFHQASSLDVVIRRDV